MKEILHYSVKKLFGQFDYDINFEVNDGFSMIAAPNSFGKSTILKSIYSVMTGNIFFFNSLEFEEMYFKFKDSKSNEKLNLTINKKAENNVVFFHYAGATHYYDDDIIRNVSNNFEGELKGYFKFSSKYNKENRYSKDFEFSDAWTESNSYDLSTLFEKSFRECSEIERRTFFTNVPWLQNFMDIFKNPCRYISAADPNYTIGYANSFLSVQDLAVQIKWSSERILQNMRSAIDDIRQNAESLTVSHPKKYMDKAQLYAEVLAEWNTASELENLHRDQLTSEGLFAVNRIKPDNCTYIEKWHPKEDDSMELLLIKDLLLVEYAKHLRDFEELFAKFDMLESTINGMIYFKKLTVGGGYGLEITPNKQDNQLIYFDKLSSGERRMISFVGTLTFAFGNIDKSEYLFYDEPENSLHPAWQEKLADFCYDAHVKYGHNFIIATHSPIFIGNRWNNVIDLYDQGMKS